MDWLSLSLIALVSAVAGWFVYDSIKLRSRIRKMREQNILEDLSLATADQLLDELRKRPKLQYITIWPAHGGPGCLNLGIEVRNLSPNDTVGLLKMSFDITAAKHNFNPQIPFGESEEENNESEE